MSSLPALENLFLRYTDIRGSLYCSMLAAAGSLRRLSLSGNTDLVGELPGCFLQVSLVRQQSLLYSSVSDSLGL